MSLILDAIKKSERERQQQEVPGLASNHDDYQRKEPSRNSWSYIVGILLLIVMIVYFVNFQNSLSPELPVTIEAPRKQIIKKTPTPENPQTKPIVQIEKSPENIVEKTINSTESQALVVKESAVIVGRVINLDSTLKNSLPKFNFSSHVFTGNSATSFVVLNDELLGVGESFNDDFKIIQINKDGMVVLFEDQQVFIKSLENITP